MNKSTQPQPAAEQKIRTIYFFTQLKAFATTHKKLLLRIFYAVMISAVIYVAYTELRHISLFQLKQVFQAQSPAVIVGMFLLGLAAFLATGLYDVFARRHFKIDIPANKAMTIGCIAQAFNNFAGLGGLTGGTLRTKHYTARGINTKQALDLTLVIWIANLLGLFVLTIITIPFAHQYLSKEIIVAFVGLGYLSFFFFGQKLHYRGIDLRSSFLAKPNFRQKGELLFASVADWFAAAFFFWACLHLFTPTLELPYTLFVYAFATIIGLVSMLPAGIGSFDVTVIAMLSAAGAQTSQILLGILLFRVAYYLLPWILALLLSTNEYISTRSTLTGVSQRINIFHTILWLGTFFCGGVLVLSALTPEVIVRVIRLNKIIPYSIQQASSLTSLSIGIALLVLSIGIKARVRRIYWVSLFALAIGAVSAMLSGLNYEEAILLSVFAILLILVRRQFDAEPLTPTLPRLILSGLLVVGVPVAVILVREFVFHQNTIYRQLADAQKPAGVAAINIVITLVIVFTLMFTKSKKLSFTVPDEAETNRFADFLLRQTGSSYSYLFGLGDKQVFYNEKESVAFLYRPHKGSLLVLGDPIGEEADFSEAIAQLIDFAVLHDMQIAFYQVSAKYLEVLVEHGLRFVKLGEDASILLDGYSNVGNSGKVFRRMRNRMIQNETEFEIIYPPFDTQTMAQLQEVSDAWLAGRTEMGYSLGFFDADYLASGPIAIVKSATRIEGFANIVLIDSQRVTFDLMRFRPDAPGGTMDGIMVSLIETTKTLGFQELNIGMAPLSNVGCRVYSHGAEKLVKYVHDFGNQIYNFKGLRAYKEKFKPTWRSRYLVYSSARSLPSVLLGLLEIINRPHDRDEHAIARLRGLFSQRMRENIGPQIMRSAPASQIQPKKQLTQKQKQRLQQKPKQSRVSVAV